MKKLGLKLALIGAFFAPLAAQANIFSTEELDSNDSITVINAAKFNGPKDALAQKAALDVARTAMTIGEERGARVVASSSNSQGNEYHVSVESRIELKGNGKTFVDTFTRNYVVTFSKSASLAAEISVSHMKTDFKETEQ